jgi:hypothetical protein
VGEGAARQLPQATARSGDAELITDTMPAYWAERINHAVEKTARAVVNTGQELIAAQAKLKHGEWLEMFNTGQVKLKLRAAQKFMQVANNPALAKAANLPLLPPSPTALVALSKLPPEVVEAGIKDGQISPGMSIADAAKFVKGHQPEPASDKGVEDTQEHQPEGASLRNGFLSILWDDAGAPPTRAPEKSYGPKTYPHLAFFRFHEAGDTRIESGTKHDLAHVGLFVVPVEEVRVVKDKQGRAICKATCRLVALSVRGNVPEPSTVPSQVIENGYDGVVEMIASMFPTALKAICTTRAETPNGWQLVPRQSSPVASSTASEVASGSLLSGTPSATASHSPSVPALPAKVADGKPEKVEGRRDAKAITVRDQVCRLRDGLDSIAAELRQRQAKASKIMRSLHSFKARGNAITTLDSVAKQLGSVLASLCIPGDSNRGGSGSVGDLPFTTQIVPRGSWYKRVGRVIEIITPLAKSIEGPAPNIYQDLQDVAAQLRSIRKQGGF